MRPDSLESYHARILRVLVHILDGGRYAITTHRGGYEAISQSYRRLCGEWLPQSGRELGSLPALEFYLNSSRTVPADQLLTDICLPLEF